MSYSVLIVEDEPVLARNMLVYLERHGLSCQTASTGEEGLEVLESARPDAVVLDHNLPGKDGLSVLKLIREREPNMPVVMATGHGSETVAVEAMKSGAFDYLIKPVSLHQLKQVLDRAVQQQRQAMELQHLRAGGGAGSAPSLTQGVRMLLGDSSAMRKLRTRLLQLVEAESRMSEGHAPAVLIGGETGTGKELVARALHEYGRRRNGPFVAINMAAIPRDLIESELFGHEKGAFTGAQNRSTGRFQQAEGGTLFLDEIGDMPMEAQTRLLRVLQQGEYTTVGGRTPIKTDVRIVAATNKDLRTLINHGQFREDLFYRLNVVPLRLPPLRERSEDIPDLVRHFFKQVEGEGLQAKRISSGGLDTMKRYPWPGNVRELENLIRRLSALYPQDEITQEIIESELRTGDLASIDGGTGAIPDNISISQAVEHYLQRYFAGFGGELPPPGLYQRVLAEVEYPLVLACMTATRGNQIKAAELLGLNRNTLRKKIRELGVNVYRGSRQG